MRTTIMMKKYSCSGKKNNDGLISENVQVQLVSPRYSSQTNSDGTEQYIQEQQQGEFNIIF